MEKEEVSVLKKNPTEFFLFLIKSVPDITEVFKTPGSLSGAMSKTDILDFSSERNNKSRTWVFKKK